MAPPVLPANAQRVLFLQSHYGFEVKDADSAAYYAKQREALLFRLPYLKQYNLKEGEKEAPKHPYNSHV